MKILIGALAVTAGLLASMAPTTAQEFYRHGRPPYAEPPAYREPPAYVARDSRQEYYAERGRIAPYYEQRTQNGRRSTVRTMEEDPRGGTIEREVWTEGGRKITRRTFTDPYGNKRVIVDRY